MPKPEPSPQPWFIEEQHNGAMLILDRYRTVVGLIVRKVDAELIWEKVSTPERHD